MNPTSSDAECAAVHDDLALLAIGTLTGRDRARVLQHLEMCPRCAAELDELSAAADSLSTLIPEASPPEGFSARTVAMIRAEHRVLRRPIAWRAMAIAAVVVALALGVGIGAVVASPGGSGPITGVRTAALHSTSGAQGTVLLSSGQNGWLIMTLNDARTSGTVTCTVTLTDGARQVVGKFTLSAGYGSWAARLPVAASQIRSVSVLDRSGATIASARLSV